MQHFVNEETAYREWIHQHPGGAVINKRNTGGYMAHVANCPHVTWFQPQPNGEDLLYTKGAGKWCFAERRELLDWLRLESIDVEQCRTCEPGIPSLA